jgi:hypothetical protein
MRGTAGTTPRGDGWRRAVWHHLHGKVLVGCAARGLDLRPDGVGDGEGEAGGGGHWTAANRRRLLLVNSKWGLWLRCACELFDVLTQTRLEEEPGLGSEADKWVRGPVCHFPTFLARQTVLNWVNRIHTIIIIRVHSSAIIIYHIKTLLINFSALRNISLLTPSMCLWTKLSPAFLLLSSPLSFLSLSMPRAAAPAPCTHCCSPPLPRQLRRYRHRPCSPSLSLPNPLLPSPPLLLPTPLHLSFPFISPTTPPLPSLPFRGATSPPLCSMARGVAVQASRARAE